MIAANAGYLTASPDSFHTEVVSDPRLATLFVDLDTALTRARLFTELGWRDLRVIEVQVPSTL